MEAFNKYKNWVRANSGSIAAVEGAVSSLTWLLPDRFSESELLLEAIHSSLGFVSLFHETILSSTSTGVPQLPWPFWLGALQQVEVLVEIGANAMERRGQINKYTALAVLEAAKAALRAMILHDSKARLLTDGGMTVSSAAATAPEASIQAICVALAHFYRRHCFQDGKKGSNEDAFGQGEADPSSSGELAGASPGSGRRAPEQYWWQRASRVMSRAGKSCRGERQDQMRQLDTQASWRHEGAHLLALGEISHIVRPLLYVLALRRWGVRSWKPWVLSLAVEAAAARLTSLSAAHSSGRQQGKLAERTPSLGSLQNLQVFRWSAVEQRELTRRKLMFLFYLLRSPFFDKYTRRGVAVGQSAVRPIPLVGSLVEKAVEILLGIQNHYTYTSAS